MTATQQQGLTAGQRAEITARMREATERAREAQQRALDAAQRAEQAQGVGRLEIPPPPEVVRVQDGRVVVGDGADRVVIDPGEPGPATQVEVRTPNDFDIPPRVENVAYSFFFTVAVIAIGVPLVRAFGRWLDRRGAPPAVPPEVTRRLEAIEQAIETVAVEVERISEGQRFTSKLLNDMREAPRLQAAERIAEPRR